MVPPANQDVLLYPPVLSVHTAHVFGTLSYLAPDSLRFLFKSGPVPPGYRIIVTSYSVVVDEVVNVTSCVLVDTEHTLARVLVKVQGNDVFLNDAFLPSNPVVAVEGVAACTLGLLGKYSLLFVRGLVTEPPLLPPLLVLLIKGDIHCPQLQLYLNSMFEWRRIKNLHTTAGFTVTHVIVPVVLAVTAAMLFHAKLVPQFVAFIEAGSPLELAPRGLLEIWRLGFDLMHALKVKNGQIKNVNFSCL